MARIKDGILGGFTGKIGNLVGYKHRGIDVVQTLPVIPKSRKTPEAIQAERDRMKLVSHFVRSLKPVLAISIRPARTDMTHQNFVVKQITKQALTGEHPNLAIDYCKVQLSHGFLPTVNKAEVVHNGDHFLFTWISNALPGTTRSRDSALVVAYNPENNRTNFLLTESIRHEGSAQLSFKSMPPGEYQTWLVFVSENGKEASPTVYCGKVVVKI